MEVSLYNAGGQVVGEVELRSDIFEVPIREPLMHQALVRQLANARLGTHKTKSRGEINRTTRKWYRQKGTGNARHGSRNANLFVGGGIAHGPKPHGYGKKMPRKMRRAALRSALSVKALDNQIVVLDALQLGASKTKDMVTVLANLGLTDRVLLLLPQRDETVEKSARNLPQVTTLRASYLNVRDLLRHDTVVMPVEALQVVESILG
jgi:large subunit ribosomal protein L4